MTVSNPVMPQCTTLRGLLLRQRRTFEIASGNSTVTTVANWVPELWSNDAQEAVEFAQVIGKRVNNDYEGEIKNFGDTVNIQTVSNYTANTKSAATDVTFETHTTPQVILVINAHQYAAFRVEKIAEKQAMPGWRERNTKKLGYALARAGEVALSALFDGFTDNGTIGTLGTELTDSDYLTAWTKLAEAGALDMGESGDDISVFLSPAAVAAALKIDKFTNKDFGADDGAIKQAAIGMLYGGRVFMSNLLEADAAGQHDCAFMHRDALTYATQSKPTVQTDFIIAALSDAVVADRIYGVKELSRPGESAANVTLSDAFGVYMASV